MKRALFIFATLAAATASFAQWSTFHGGPKRTGLASVAGPAAPNIQWSIDLGGPVIASPIVAPDGTIYIGPLWDETNKKPRSYFHAINPDGTHKWKYEIPYRDKQFAIAPTLDSGGNVYFGDSAGVLRSLTPAGLLRWQYQATQPIIAHPLVVGARIYAHLDGALVAMNRSNGSILWQFPLGLNMMGGPSVDDAGNIYSTSDTGIVAVRPDGTLIWRSILGGGSSPVAISPTGAIIATGYFLQSLNASTGEIQWFENTGNSVNPDVTPTVDALGNFFYMNSWAVTKYNPSGVLLWDYMFLDVNRLGDCHTSFVLDSANRLYVATGWYKRAAISIEKRVYCFNANTGAVLWTLDLPEIPSPSSPALGPNGALYVGCTDGKLYSIK